MKSHDFLYPVSFQGQRSMFFIYTRYKTNKEKCLHRPCFQREAKEKSLSQQNAPIKPSIQLSNTDTQERERWSKHPGKATRQVVTGKWGLGFCTCADTLLTSDNICLSQRVPNLMNILEMIAVGSLMKVCHKPRHSWPWTNCSPSKRRKTHALLKWHQGDYSPVSIPPEKQNLQVWDIEPSEAFQGMPTNSKRKSPWADFRNGSKYKDGPLSPLLTHVIICL